MNATRHWLLGALLIALPAVVASGPTVAAMAMSVPAADILDDSGTVAAAALPMRWRRLAPGHGFDNLVTGETLVNVRLATAAWLGRRARIYMALDRSNGVEVRATWTSSGKLLPGSVASGDRAPVFSGIIRDPSLSGTLTMTMSADGRQLTSPIPLRFQFQIEAER